MGHLVKIQLKTTEDTTIEVLNQELHLMGILNLFVTNQSNQDWVDDINKNPESYQYMIPMTLEKLKEVFSFHTNVGMMSFDIAFGRLQEEDATKIAKFIENNIDGIEFIDNANDFIERYGDCMTDDQKNIISKLDKPEENPTLLPEDLQTNPTFQGGQFLCDSFSPNPFWVIFGKVDKPSFLKIKKYENDLLNPIYRDKQGYAYLMMPLMPVGSNGLEIIKEAFDHAWVLGLREHPSLLLPILYGVGSSDINNIAKEFEDFYHGDIEDKFIQVFKHTNNKFNYNNYQGFIWNDKTSQFKPVNWGSSISSQLTALCQVLTALLMAMGSKKSAELMSKVTGKPYKEFEFKFDVNR